MRPIRFNRGQALALWGLMAQLPVEAQLDVYVFTGNPEIMVRAESDMGEAFYRLPPDGGSFPVDSSGASTPADSEAPHGEIVSRDEVAPDIREP